jgi:hypothetical protein
MISPAAHAGGGNNRNNRNGGGGGDGSSNNSAAERRGADRPPASSPIHLDQNSNKSSLARGRSVPDRQHGRPPASPASLESFAGGHRSTGSSPHHHLISPADLPPSSSPVAFLPHVGGSGEFRPPWLPADRSSNSAGGVGGRPWLLPSTDPLLLHPLRAPLGFVAPPLLPAGQTRGGGGGPLLLPSPLDFARLAAGGLLPPLGVLPAAATFPPHMLEQLYRHQPPSPTTSAVVVVCASSPLPQFYSTGPETQKRKRSNSFVEEASERDSRGLAASASLPSFLSSSPHSAAADGRPPFKSRLPASPSLDATQGQSAEGARGDASDLAGGQRWRPTATAGAVSSSGGVATAAALPAPIMSVRPSSSSSSELTRPGHPAHFTQVGNEKCTQFDLTKSVFSLFRVDLAPEENYNIK